MQQITQRVDSISSGTGSATDTFSYDSLNRLTQYQSTGPGSTHTVTLAYNALGMMLIQINKSDVGVYAGGAAWPRHRGTAAPESQRLCIDLSHTLWGKPLDLLILSNKT